MALFSIARPDTFATWENWQSIFNLGSVVMVMAAALTVPMIMGDFDLSVGYNAQLLGAVAIVLAANVAISTGFTIVLHAAARRGDRRGHRRRRRLVEGLRRS